MLIVWLRMGRSSPPPHAGPTEAELLALPGPALAPPGTRGRAEALGSAARRGAAANLLLQASAPSPRSTEPYHPVTTVHLTSLKVPAPVGIAGTGRWRVFYVFCPSLAFINLSESAEPSLVVCPVIV